MPRFEYIPLSMLAFDPRNPRLPKNVEGEDQASVMAWMLKDAGLIDLMRSIADQGFFPGEPILVCTIRDGGTSGVGERIEKNTRSAHDAEDSSDSDKAYTVVEGNRRLAASLLLANPSLAPSKKVSVAKLSQRAEGQNLSVVPALVFESRDEILAHLGYRHITGIKEWDPEAKARFLREEFDALSGSADQRFRVIARKIGSRSDYVGRLLTALAIYERVEENDFYSLAGVNAQSVSFSFITSALAYNSLWEYLGLESAQDIEMTYVDDRRLEFLTAFMFQKVGRRTRLIESRNIGRLAEVISDPTARKRLEEGDSLDEAERFLSEDMPAVEVLVEDVLDSLQLLKEALLAVEDMTPARDAIQEIRLSIDEIESLVQGRG